MPSRLSSLLVRDGLVGVKRMEKAFQRQVIYGGSLDTILLEMSLVPEERLTQYLALASGLPPAARDEGHAVEPAAIALLAADLALQFRAVPLTLEGDALRVLVCSPIELSELEDLADLLDRALQPLITPEYRWHLAFASAYGAEAPARFSTLARTLEIETAPAAIGRAASVIIAEGVPAAEPDPPVLPSDVTTDLPAMNPGGSTQPFVPMTPRPPAPAQPVLAPVTSDHPTLRMVVPPELRHRQTLVGLTPAGGEPEEIAARLAMSGRASAPLIAAFAPVAIATGDDSNGVPQVVEDAASRRTGSQPIATAGRDSPLAIVRARELLAAAEDRDTVFITLLRAARARARYAGLLTVQGGAAIGRVALAELGLDTAAIATALVPLDVVSPFRSVVGSHQPHIGSLASSDPAIDAMMLRLGGAVPPSALLMPIVLRDRVVAIVVAHRGQSDLKLVDVAELLPLAAAAADALGRLIVRHKTAQRVAVEVDSGPTPVAAEGPITQRFKRAGNEWTVDVPGQGGDDTELGYAAHAHDYAGQYDAGAYSSASESHAAMYPAQPGPPSAPQPVVAARPREPITIDALFDQIEQAPEGGALAQIAEAIDRDAETLRALVRRFPGALRVDRFAVTGRPLHAAQYGGLLELCVRLGDGATELLVDKLAAPQRDIRFYATVCLGELRPEAAIVALVERIFDHDYGVRAAALEALAGYPPGELAQPMARARRALHSTDVEVVASAAAAIVALGDTDAVGDLIGALERPDKGHDHARRALVALTAQDFSSSERKWLRWWDGSRKQHRIEWLIAGLAHKDDAIRERSINDLRRLTGEYFGYQHDLPRKERELAAERWVAWWRESGQRRFVDRENERNRPTALLPGRPPRP